MCVYVSAPEPIQGEASAQSDAHANEHISCIRNERSGGASSKTICHLSSGSAISTVIEDTFYIRMCCCRRCRWAITETTFAQIG